MLQHLLPLSNHLVDDWSLCIYLSVTVETLSLYLPLSIWRLPTSLSSTFQHFDRRKSSLLATRLSFVVILDILHVSYQLHQVVTPDKFIKYKADSHEGCVWHIIDPSVTRYNQPTHIRFVCDIGPQKPSNRICYSRVVYYLYSLQVQSISKFGEAVRGR